MEVLPQVGVVHLARLPPRPLHRRTRRPGEADHTGEPQPLPPSHEASVAVGAGPTLTFRDAAAETRTGDVWLFRGPSTADRAIRLVTNSPFNHVGMVIAIDDLPPLLWHAELGASLPDVWAGEHRRGAQLHRLDGAVATWVHRYGQAAWFRPIDREVDRTAENAALRAVADLGGRPFPRTAALARRWLRGRVAGRSDVQLEDLFCAEIVALTYERMGLLGADRPPNWYDPGRFWSGDRLQLVGASLGPEVAVTDVPPLD